MYALKDRKILASTIVMMVILLLACAPQDKPNLDSDATVPMDTSATEEKPIFIIRQAGIESIQIQELESIPVKVIVVVNGWLSDSCTSLDQITQEREGKDFLITITTKRPADVNCLQMIMPFEQTISLDVLGLKAGTYTVTVNRMSDTFSLDVDNVLQK